MNYIVIGFIRGYFNIESNLLTMPCLLDDERIQFETLITAEIMGQDELLNANLKGFSQQLFEEDAVRNSIYLQNFNKIENENVQPYLKFISPVKD